MEKSEHFSLRGFEVADLRRIAEEILRKQPLDTAAMRAVPTEDTQKLIDELRIYQIELQMQNEELARGRLELENSQNVLRQLYDSAPVGYFTIDGKGKIAEVNLAGATMLGIERSKLAGQLFGKFVTAESEQEYCRLRKNISGTGERLKAVLLMVKPDGSRFSAQVDGIAVPGGKAGLCHFSLLDNSLLIRAEQALQHSEQKYHTLIVNIPAVTWTRDRQGTLTFVSPNSEAVLGFCGQELLGTDLRFWRRQVHPEDAPLLIQSFMRMLAQGTSLDVQYRFRHKKGHWIWLQSRALGRSEESNNLRVDGILIDITERRRAEDQAREFQRRQISLERQAALGQMAAAVAHEISNPLGGIQNAFLLLKKSVPEDHPNARFVALADKEIRRMSEIVRQMTMFYHPQSGKRCECDAVAAVKDTLELLAADSRAHEISMQVQCTEPKVCVRMNESEFRQVIFNIVINALQASVRGDVVDIEIQRAGEKCQIAVTDHGKGMDESTLSHIFEPFFTGSKRSETNGMGIGLSVSRNLVEAAGGFINVKTVPNSGSTFTIMLPCAKSAEKT